MRSRKKAGLSTRCDETRAHVMISTIQTTRVRKQEATLKSLRWIMMRCTHRKFCALLTFKTRDLTRTCKKETQGLCTMRITDIKCRSGIKHCQRKERTPDSSIMAFMVESSALRGHIEHLQSRHIKNRIPMGPATQMQQKDTKA